MLDSQELIPDTELLEVADTPLSLGTQPTAQQTLSAHTTLATSHSTLKPSHSTIDVVRQFVDFDHSAASQTPFCTHIPNFVQISRS